MVNDPVGDLIIRLKNAGAVHADLVSVPYSDAKLAVASKLAQEGYVKSVAKRGKKVHRALDIELLYHDSGAHAIRGVKRISKPGRRIYRGVSELYPVRHGRGRLIVSTPRGILTGEEAKRGKVGGEALFEIW